jgi:DNA-binding transcriptional MerR regulator
VDFRRPITLIIDEQAFESSYWVMIYTAKKIADTLERPATTIRTWADKYKDFIPLGDKKAGRRRYNDEGLDVFKKIGELHDKGLIGDEVKEYLAKEFPVHMDADTPEETNSGTALVLRKEYQETLHYFTAMLQKQDEMISVQREELAFLKETLGLKKNEAKVDKMDTIKKTPAKKKKLTKVNKSKIVKKGNKKLIKDKSGRFRKKGWFEKLFS